MKSDTLSKTLVCVSMVCLALLFALMFLPFEGYYVAAFSVFFTALDLVVLAGVLSVRVKAEKASVTHGKRLFTVGWVASLAALAFTVPVYWVRDYPFSPYVLLLSVYWLLSASCVTLAYGLIVKRASSRPAVTGAS